VQNFIKLHCKCIGLLDIVLTKKKTEKT